MFPPEKHGVISPSRLQRIVDCPGSFKLCKDKRQKSSIYADEGTMLHGLVERCINSGLRPIAEDIPSPWDDPAMTEEYLNAVNDCLDYYYNLLKTIPDAESYVEVRVDLKAYDSCLLECYGTCDIVIVGKDEIHVIDWKFGKGVPVFAKNNDQLYAYAAGAILKYISRPRNQVYIHCIQPRLNSYDSHVMTDNDLGNWLRSRIIPGIQRAQSDNAPFNPGTSQCRWCPAKVGCRARHNFANQTAADIFAAHTQVKTVEVDDEELAETLRKAEVYEEYIKDLRKHVTLQLEQGKQFTGWKIVAGRSNRKWGNEDSAMNWMSSNCDGDYDRLVKTKIISPAEAERKFRHWKKEEDFHKLIIKPPGKHKLVISSDPRPAIDFKTASEKFKEALKNEG